VSGRATAADPTGRYVGGDLTTADGRIHAVLWNGGGLTELTAGLDFPGVADINVDGTVVGNGGTGNGWTTTPRWSATPP
jgi:uncharacterized membrane protein